MSNRTKVTDAIWLGFMIFSFYLGAGNIIFPPLAGYLSGEHVWLTMSGFLLTAVGLPLLGLLAISKTGTRTTAGNITSLTRFLPSPMATCLMTLLYIIMGPAFAIPRTGLVAYEMGVKPWFTTDSDVILFGYSLLFFILVSGCALCRGALIDNIGKYLTPMFTLALLILGLAVFLTPQGVLTVATSQYLDAPFSKGIIDGYNTMDALASLMFGSLIINLLKLKGSDSVGHSRQLIFAGIIAAAGLTLVYFLLFKLGSTAGGIPLDDVHGAAIVIAYVNSLFGQAGTLVLALIITLACFTTAVGLLSACADYFHPITGLSHAHCTLIIAILCLLVTNAGLMQLIDISIPFLLSIYPVIISLIFLNLLQNYLPNKPLSFRAVTLVALLFGMLDALTVAGVPMAFMNSVPLYTSGLAWLIPTCGTLLLTLFIPAGVSAHRDENQQNNGDKMPTFYQ